LKPALPERRTSQTRPSPPACSSACEEAEARSKKAGHSIGRAAEGKVASAAERDPGTCMPNCRTGRRGGGHRMRVSEGGVMRGGNPFQLPLFLSEVSADLVQPLVGAAIR
jgi:hypothetical protein